MSYYGLQSMSEESTVGGTLEEGGCQDLKRFGQGQKPVLISRALTTDVKEESIDSILTPWRVDEEGPHPELSRLLIGSHEFELAGYRSSTQRWQK